MYRKIVFLLITSLFISSCSGQYFKQRDTKYLASIHGSELLLPEDVNADNISDYYVLPTITGFPGASPLPPQVELDIPSAKQVPLTPKLPESVFSATEHEDSPALLVAVPHQQMWITLPSALYRKKLHGIAADQEELSFLFSEVRLTPEEVDDDTDLYKIRLVPYGDKTILTISDRQDNALAQEEAERLLESLVLGFVSGSNHSVLWTLGGVLSYEDA